MKCPSRKCPFFVWDNLIAKLLGNNSKIYERYQRFLLDDFVDKSPTIIFCPSPDCPTATEVDDKMLSRSGRLPQKDVVCSCNNLICLRCEALGHEPLGCEIFEEWEENLDKKKDQLSGFWMKSHTKGCPKCSIKIEKNQGCMHMTCPNCKWDFCWMCLEEWKKHGSTTGGYYKCNIFKDDPDGKKKINDEERDMKKLEFYLDRYAENKSAFKKTLEEIAEFKRAVFE